MTRLYRLLTNAHPFTVCEKPQEGAEATFNHRWLQLQLALLRKIGRDNLIAPTPPNGIVQRIVPGAAYPVQYAIRDRSHGDVALSVRMTTLSGNIVHAVIAWQVDDDITATVWVSRDGGPEVLFANGTHGSEGVSWLDLDSGYIFSLYSGVQGTIRRCAVPVIPAYAFRKVGCFEMRVAAHLATRLLTQRLSIWFSFTLLPALFACWPRPCGGCPAPFSQAYVSSLIARLPP